MNKNWFRSISTHRLEVVPYLGPFLFKSQIEDAALLNLPTEELIPPLLRQGPSYGKGLSYQISVFRHRLKDHQKEACPQQARKLPLRARQVGRPGR